jgi:hypothetical protein
VRFKPGYSGLRRSRRSTTRRTWAVVAEAAEILHRVVERDLAAVAERGMPDVVRQREGLAQRLVQRQRVPEAAGDLAHLEAVGQARAVLVAFPVDEDLRLVHQPAERRAMDDAVPIALEARAELVLALAVPPTPRARAEGRPRRQLPRLARLLGAAVEELGGGGRGDPSNGGSQPNTMVARP